MPKQLNSLVLERLSYLSPLGGRYKGQLTITEDEVLFESNFDPTFEVLFRNAMKKLNGKKYFALSKEDISSVRFKKKLFTGEVSLSLNGKIHIFSKRNLSENQVVDAFKYSR